MERGFRFNKESRDRCVDLGWDRRTSVCSGTSRRGFDLMKVVTPVRIGHRNMFARLSVVVFFVLDMADFL